MRYMLVGFLSALELRMRRLRGWAVLLLLPLLIFAADRCLPEEEVSAPVQVGVALPAEGAEEFRTLLEARSGTVLTFIMTDEEAIERNVAVGRWDCGLVLAEDFHECLETLDTDRLFTLYVGPGSTVYPLVKEAVAACVAELIGPYIAREYLLDSGIVDSQASLQRLWPEAEEILTESDRVLVSMTTADGTALDPVMLADSGIDSVLRWMVSAVILVWLLYCAADLGRWIGSPAVSRMRPLRPVTCLMLSRIGADGLVVFLAGSLAMLLVGDGLWGWAAVLAYVLFLGAASVLIAHFPGIWTSLPVWSPFAVVISFLMSSALVDLSVVIPALSGVSGWSPAAMFLRICRGDLTAMAALLAAAAVCVAASFAVDKIQK